MAHSCSEEDDQVKYENHHTTPESRNDAGPHPGPIHGTKVDVMDGEVDVADFDCPEMDHFDQSGTSVYDQSFMSFINTVCGAQRPEMPPLPSKEEAMKTIEYFLDIVLSYIPVLHKPSVIDLVCCNRFPGNEIVS